MLKTLIAAGLFLAMPIASADTLLLDGINAARNSANLRPARGMSMDAVQSAFGAPSAQRDAVGPYTECTENRFCPPITRWDYPGFIVYFEHDKVIRAVVTP